MGIGLRYPTPVGPVSLDFGYQINPAQYQATNTHNEHDGSLPAAAFSILVQYRAGVLMRKNEPVSARMITMPVTTPVTKPVTMPVTMTISRTSGMTVARTIARTIAQALAMAASLGLLAAAAASAQTAGYSTVLPAASRVGASETVDSIAARIEDDILTESELRELGAFQTLVDGQSKSRADLIRELEDQWIVRGEATAASYPETVGGRRGSRLFPARAPVPFPRRIQTPLRLRGPERSRRPAPARSSNSTSRVFSISVFAPPRRLPMPRSMTTIQMSLPLS